MGWAPAQPWIRWADGWMGGWWMDYFRWYFHCWYIMICIMITWGSLQHLKSLLPSGWIYRAQREESMTAAAKNKTKKRNTVNTFTCTTKLNVWLFLRVQGSFYKLSNEMQRVFILFIYLHFICLEVWMIHRNEIVKDCIPSYYMNIHMGGHRKCYYNWAHWGPVFQEILGIHFLQ